MNILEFAESIWLYFTNGLAFEETPPVVLIFSLPKRNLDAVCFLCKRTFFRLNAALEFRNLELIILTLEIIDSESKRASLKLNTYFVTWMRLDPWEPIEKNLDPFSAGLIIGILYYCHVVSICCYLSQWVLGLDWCGSHLYWLNMLLGINRDVHWAINITSFLKKGWDQTV